MEWTRYCAIPPHDEHPPPPALLPAPAPAPPPAPPLAPPLDSSWHVWFCALFEVVKPLPHTCPPSSASTVRHPVSKAPAGMSAEPPASSSTAFPLNHSSVPKGGC